MTRQILFKCPNCGKEKWEYDDGKNVKCINCGKKYKLKCEWEEIK